MTTQSACGRRFAYTDSCVDYRSYRHPLDPTVSSERHAQLRDRLAALGRAEPERMGVTYVRGPWGFLVIPRQGFPELRISFFRDTPDGDRRALLESVCQALGACSCRQERHDQTARLQ